jgi:hypothetical protein
MGLAKSMRSGIHAFSRSHCFEGPIGKSIKRFTKSLLGGKAVRAATTQPIKKQIWSIGIYAGKSPLELAPVGQVSNPVLTADSVSDARAMFVADPFMLETDGKWHMFFEVMNLESGRGEIGLATSPNALQWSYQQIVLREQFHLSYPYTFKWNGAYYMVPETHQANSIRLYKAVEFPTHWSFVRTLIDGADFVDPTIFHCNDHWWLFTDFARPPFYAGTLRLFRADHLEGSWAEHPESPVIEGNPHISRPAGRVVHQNGQMFRFTQDCCPDYGTQVRAFEITDLTPTTYREHAVELPPIVQAAGTKWNESGMHHVDPHWTDQGQWIACVDGFYWKTSAGK